MIPKFLEPNGLTNLNNRLLKETGCFLFWDTTPYPLKNTPESWEDAFLRYTISLYCIYHDQACHMLNFYFHDSNCPPEFPLSPLSSLRQHARVIDTALRPMFAHGMHHYAEFAEFQSQMVNYYIQYPELDADVSWPEFREALTESHWENATKRLVADADKLYDFLLSWADRWKEEADKNSFLTWQKLNFSTSNELIYSFDMRVCKILYENDVLPAVRVKNPNAVSNFNDSLIKKKKLSRWQSNLRAECSHRQLHTPEPIKTTMIKIITDDLHPVSTPASIAAKHNFGVPPIPDRF